MKSIDISILSKNRSQIYGVATIMILMVHSLSYSNWDTSLLKVLHIACKYGSLGVPIFAFLSGLSIYYSCQKNGLHSFFRNRINRTFVPFFIMAVCFCAVIYLILDFQPFTFLKEITTLSFWLDHHGPWYIAMLLPLYAVSPLYFKLINSRYGEGNFILSLIVIFIIGIIMNHCNTSLYNHISNVYASMLLYFSGMYIGKLMKSKKTISLWLFFIPLFAQVGQMLFYKCIDNPIILSTYNPVRDLCYSSLAVTLSFVLAYIFEVLNSSHVNKVFSFLGSISLESYLWNTYLGYCLCMAIEKHVSIVTENKMLFYLFICALGLLMSKPYQNIINRIKK